MIITKDLVELIGIILGDGGIHYDENSHHYTFSITLNGIDEEEYVKYVENLIHLIFGIIPSKKWEKDKPSASLDSKAVSLNVYSKSIVSNLIKIGLISGNKIENQIRVPDIVFLKKDYITHNE